MCSCMVFLVARLVVFVFVSVVWMLCACLVFACDAVCTLRVLCVYMLFVCGDRWCRGVVVFDVCYLFCYFNMVFGVRMLLGGVGVAFVFTWCCLLCILFSFFFVFRFCCVTCICVGIRCVVILACG